MQDFEGQGRAERLSRIIITLFGVVGLIWGFAIQQFSQAVYILVAGVLLTLIVSGHRLCPVVFLFRRIEFNTFFFPNCIGYCTAMANLPPKTIELAKGKKRWEQWRF